MPIAEYITREVIDGVSIQGIDDSELLRNYSDKGIQAFADDNRSNITIKK